MQPILATIIACRGVGTVEEVVDTAAVEADIAEEVVDTAEAVAVRMAGLGIAGCLAAEGTSVADTGPTAVLEDGDIQGLLGVGDLGVDDWGDDDSDVAWGTGADEDAADEDCGDFDYEKDGRCDDA
eukprot:Gregarina_sp_Poly_1__6248@NODE_3311_length_1191_cov_1145_616548_g2101_i0_p1_GENE_NODE_3311_length_1191_cov_1145_616548_g2101_i0NODE_3311_length_1191_cov_1145_616548_g2101_i0_p1_ORF_typecomplete_len126_score19_52_NODE_3311_length_1191_cov_1145_616548_g2101_i0153530